MKKRNNISNEKELELGKYLEADMIEITKDEVAGGGGVVATVSLVVTWVASYISDNTCPTTACTRSC